MKPPPMHPSPPGLDLAEDTFTIRVLDHDHPKATEGRPINVYEGPATFTARPLPYRKAWGHRYEVVCDTFPLPSFIARVGPGSQFADYRPGADRFDPSERYHVILVDRAGHKDPVPTASELETAILSALAPHGITEIRFG